MVPRNGSGPTTAATAREPRDFSEPARPLISTTASRIHNQSAATNIADAAPAVAAGVAQAGKDATADVAEIEPIHDRDWWEAEARRVRSDSAAVIMLQAEMIASCHLRNMKACPTCGARPCCDPSFCAACCKEDARLAAERKTGRQVESAGILRARRLRADDVSLERAWHDLNDPRNHPTPQVTIEAIMYSVHAYGLAALKVSANMERLSRCDATAKAQIDERIQKLIDAKKIAHG